MPIYDLYNDTSKLPKTRRGGTPYEIEALSPREVWGAGNGSTTLVCRQDFNYTEQWIREMVGQVVVTYRTGVMALKRFIPEPIRYDFGTERIQFCTLVDQVEQAGKVGSEEDIFASNLSGWPICRWSKYRVTWESLPYAILDDGKSVYALPDMADIVSGAGAYAGARELYRYIVRTRKTYSREQPIPAASVAGGFKTIDDAVPANRKPIGQIGFRVVSMADVQYKWVRVPVGWPPPTGYVPPNTAAPWPPPFNPAAFAPSANLRARDRFIGTTNSDWWDCAAADGYCWAPETLLYLGYDDSNKYYDAAGDWVCDVVYSFKYKEGGWNKFLNAKGAWVEVSLTGTTAGARPYSTNNFDALFEYS